MSLRPTREGNTIVDRDAQRPNGRRRRCWRNAPTISRRRTRLPARKWLRMLRALPAAATDGAGAGAADPADCADRRRRTH